MHPAILITLGVIGYLIGWVLVIALYRIITPLRRGDMEDRGEWIVFLCLDLFLALWLLALPALIFLD
jgi:hypothetical protein